MSVLLAMVYVVGIVELTMDSVANRRARTPMVQGCHDGRR